MIDTVPGLLRVAAQRWGGKTALVAMDEAPASFAQLDEAADRFARALIADGSAHGDRIGIWAPNMWEWVAAAVGAQRTGAAIVPLNMRLRTIEVTDILRRARVSRLVSIGEHRGEDMPAMLRGEDLPELVRIVVLRDGSGGRSGREASWDAFLERGAGVTDTEISAREAAVTGETVSDILFTSGTTGQPKGAVFCHDATVRSGQGMVNFARVGERDCLCPLGPFAHFAGYKGGWVNGLATGASVCWSEAHDPASLIAAIETLRISVMPAPPVVWQDILDFPGRASRDLSSLRFIATGSTTIPPALVRRLIAELKVEQVGTGFGLTESGGMTNFARRDDPVERLVETSGRAAPDAEVRIMAADGSICPPGVAGEIVVRTKRQLTCYLDDPDATRAAIDAEGWLRTGDVGHVDAEGYLTITDRLKDMFITNGYNVYPAELEKLMGAIPGVAQCAVIGVPHPRKGEAGHAFVVRAAGSAIDADEVIAWCRANVAGYKVPGTVSFIDALPRNSQGKVLKQELRAMV